MAPPRHKRGRSSTSSRASANLQKTEVTINVYDLLPVSLISVVTVTHGGKQPAYGEEARCLNSTFDHRDDGGTKQKLTLPPAIPSIHTPLDHRIFPPPLRRSSLHPKQRPNRVRLRRPPSTTENRRLPHATPSNATRSSIPM
jgi:hypothetical protein